MLEKLASTKLLFVHRDASIADAVRVMIGACASSVLVHDDERRVVGILTERDVVRKYTLLELDLKSGRSVGTIMTRPVVCVRTEALEADVVRLHFDLGLRHFPVVTRVPPSVDDVLGMITVTDLCRSYLHALHAKLAATEQRAVRLIAPAASASERAAAEALVRSTGRAVLLLPPGAAADALESGEAVVLVLAGLDQWTRERWLADLRKAKGPVVLLAAGETGLALHERFAGRRSPRVALEPADPAYLAWLLSAA